LILIYFVVFLYSGFFFLTLLHCVFLFCILYLSISFCLILWSFVCASFCCYIFVCVVSNVLYLTSNFFSSFCESFYFFFLLFMFFSYFSIMSSIDGTSLKKKNVPRVLKMFLRSWKTLCCCFLWSNEFLRLQASSFSLVAMSIVPLSIINGFYIYSQCANVDEFSPLVSSWISLITS